jgi:murein DD-endopeptidase MepM/ murein hydrolase activator NlpD
LNTKLKGFLVFLLLLNLALGYNLIKKSEKGTVDLTSFVDYYANSEAENGGYVLLESNFKIYEKQYKIINEVEAKKEKLKVERMNRGTIVYSVVSGDTVGGIANKFGQSQGVLKYNNPSIGKYLKIGQKLKITNGNSVEYKVVKGDTLGKISGKFGRSVTAIQRDNSLTSTTVHLNQKLVINNPKITTISKPKSGFNVYWPVAWEGITSPYGRRFHPVLKKWIGHLGVDLRARYVPVKAAESGVITYAGWMSGYGNIIIIKHSKGYESRYGHLQKIKVRKGQKVKRGQLIATSGKTGRVTGPHLHFEIRKYGTPVNPMTFFK